MSGNVLELQIHIHHTLPDYGSKTVSQIGEKAFGCRHAIFIKLMVMFFCLFCSCSCTQVTPVTALTRLKSDRVSAPHSGPARSPQLLLVPPAVPPRSPLWPPQYHLGPLSRPRFPLWSPQVLPQPSRPWSPPPWSCLSALTPCASPSFFQCNALESKHQKGRLGPRVRHVTLFGSNEVGWGPVFVT